MATVAALRETSILFALLISVIVLKEKASPWRYLAGAIIALGAGSGSSARWRPTPISQRKVTISGSIPAGIKSSAQGARAWRCRDKRAAAPPEPRGGTYGSRERGR